MSKIILGVVIGLALGAAGVMTLVKYPGVADFLKPSEEAEEQEKQAEAETSFVQHEAGGQIAVKLDQETQSRIGLKTVALAAAQAPAEVRGFGRVLDPAPLAALVAEGASAQAALQASTKEYDRVKTLFAQDRNASARALETAEAAMNKDRIAVESVRLRLLAGWGQEVAGQADLPAFVASLAARQAALVRVDVPLGEHPKAPPTAVQIASMATPDERIDAQILGPAPSTDPQSQTEGYLVLVGASPRARPDEGQTQGGQTQGSAPTPGAALIAYLIVPGPARAGVIVPREAVLRHEGETFVYRQTDAETFQRQAVALERPDGAGWFSADQGLKAQEKVVVVGAQQLLSEELKGQGGEEE